MIELNLLEQKQPYVLPTVLGMNLNAVNLKMLGVAFVLYYMPSYVVDYMFQEKMATTQASIDQIVNENNTIKEKLDKNIDVKSQLEAYKKQVEKLQNRSNQVDEILKNRTNPKKVLEKIARSIPEDVWFNELVISDKNEITIEGGSYSPRGIGEFITVINDSPFFGATITPSRQENKKDTLDGVMTNFEEFQLKGKIINFEMRAR